MINPIYKFEIDSRQFHPIYNSDLSKVYEKESGEEFFRAKLNGKLIFVKDDYDYIMSQVFDYKYQLVIYISYDAGSTWSSYWTGRFWRTDCAINEDDKSIEVTPQVVDEYTDILDGMEREYDLIQLVPKVEEIYMDRRPMIQVYIPGDTTIGCFMSGMWWEQECTAVTDESQLENHFYFYKNADYLIFETKTQGFPTLPDAFCGPLSNSEFVNGNYKIRISTIWEIVRVSDNVTLWTSPSPSFLPGEITFSPQNGAQGNVVLTVYQKTIYARFVCDVGAVGITPTHEIPSDDLVPYNRNYKRVAGYNHPDTILFYDGMTTTPTKWGLYQPGVYYAAPRHGCCPLARANWTKISLWFVFTDLEYTQEILGRHRFKLKDAFPIYSVLSVLLGKIAPSIYHEGTSTYSQFLYYQNPLTNEAISWYITPKSNILNGEYDQPAQKAPITLRQIFDMLRDCFRCYWYVDGNKLKIEHIKFFMNGGSYSGTASVGRDLTTEQVVRNGKKWAFCTSKYTYDKEEMPSRYEFGWMDDVTEYFEGDPIDILSNFVEKDNVQKIDVQNFTSDVDYLMINPSGASQDGFALLGAMAASQTNLVTSPTSDKALVALGATATLSGWSISEYLPVIGLPMEGAGGKPESAIYVKYCVYDENYAFMRDGNGIYYPKEGERYIRFTLPSNDVRAYFYFLYLPYLDWQVDGVHNILQNGKAAFVYLENFYLYDLPAYSYSRGGVAGTALGIKKNKRQTLNFPCITDPNLINLVKTNMGDGKIGKISINLSSRNANVELMYDTE